MKLYSTAISYKVEWPSRKRVDNIIDYRSCRASLQELSYSAKVRTKWNKIIQHQTPMGTQPKVYDDW